jgi:hypothetical protein
LVYENQNKKKKIYARYLTKDIKTLQSDILLQLVGNIEGVRAINKCTFKPELMTTSE